MCDETGTRSQTVTNYACNGSGSCIGTDDTETQNCNRDTDGEMCMPTETGSWSGCLVDTRTDPCNEDGIQSRSVTTYECSSGSCQGSDSTQMQACSQDSFGRICPNPLAPDYPCFKYRCSSSAVCQNTGTTCMADEAYCTTGCEPTGGGGGMLCLE